MQKRRYIVLLATACHTRGGIASVIAGYLAAGLAERWPLVHLATHADGSRWTKLRLAAAALLRFLGLLLSRQVGVVHVHCASDASFYRKAVFIAIALLARRPVIFHLHGGGFLDFYGERCGPLGRRAVRFVLDRAARIVTLSAEGAGRIAGITGNARVSVIPNMADARILRARPQRDPHGAELLFLGRLEPAKGIDELLEAVAQLRTRFPRLRLTLAGTGDLPTLAARAAALGIAERIEFTGWVDAERKLGLLGRAHAFVLPSHVENMPVSVLEAMAAGLPVIATRVGALAELVVHGATGLLVPPRDAAALALAIATILGDRELRARMGDSARRRAEREFGVEKLLPRLEAIYRDLGAQERDPVSVMTKVRSAA